MKGRERVHLALDHKEADRVPRYDAFWDETIEQYKSELGLLESTTLSEIGDHFDFDIVVFALDNSMRFEAKVVEEDEEMIVINDRCGYSARKRKKSPLSEFFNHVNKDYATWQTMRHRFSLEKTDSSRVDRDGFFLRTTPVPSWEEAKKAFEEEYKNGKFLMLQGYGVFEGTWRHRGYENLLMDLVLDEKYTHEMFEAIIDLTIDTLTFAMEIGIKPDGYWVVDDLGSTRAPLFSPETYRKMVLPHHRKLGDFLRKNGIRYLMHSCGNIESFIPGFIEAGIEAIQPLQANTEMDLCRLKRLYGNDITFWGNISNQEIAKGYEAIEKEVAAKLPVAMKGGGYIYHSDHSIPSDTPVEYFQHVMKMLDKYGDYKK
jgi:uroporphyrinogen decarboxylase